MSSDNDRADAGSSFLKRATELDTLDATFPFDRRDQFAGILTGDCLHGPQICSKATARPRQRKSRKAVTAMRDARPQCWFIEAGDRDLSPHL
ncbi:MAG: hypothetical protein KL863_19715 [Rhizobium sp.]|nr:hypothetical protein [Rhizobium sp.]